MSARRLSSRRRKRLATSRRAARATRPTTGVTADVDTRAGWRRRRLLRLGWPWPLIGLAALWGAAATGPAGALFAAAFGLVLYALGSRAAISGSPDARWHIRAAMVSAVAGVALLFAGGAFVDDGRARPAENPSPALSIPPSSAR